MITEKTILLKSGSISLNMFSAVCMLVNGIMLSFGGEWYFVSVGVFTILSSIYCAGYTWLNFSKNSKYAPKMRIGNKQIELKQSFWKEAFVVNCEEVKQIHLGQYKVKFELANEVIELAYDTASEKSKQIKKALRALAMERQILVSGN